MPTVSYGLRISRENHIFDQTIEVYRAAVNYLMDIVSLHYDMLAAAEPTVSATVQQVRQGIVEHLVHSTRENTAAYPEFDKRFYKFPSYLRRDAIMTAIGKIFAYRAWITNWKADGRKGKRPFLNRNQDVMPCFYRKNTFLQDGNHVSLKLYNGSDWVWHEVRIRPSDFRYVLEQMTDWKESAPVLAKRNRRYELRFAYTAAKSRFPKFQKDKDVDTVLGVDLGINAAASWCVMEADGTVQAKGVTHLSCEEDHLNHMINRKRMYQQAGKKSRCVYRWVTEANRQLSIQTAKALIDLAVLYNVDCIVFEHLDSKGKIRGRKYRERIHLWRKNDVQKRVELQAHRLGMRISRVCAWGTSKYAFDGSGVVDRHSIYHFEHGDKVYNYSLCTFQTGKIYNCDLSAAQNIGARFFLREYIKRGATGLPATPQRTLSTLRELVCNGLPMAA